MDDRQVLEPTAEHPIGIDERPGWVVVRAAGRLIADTKTAVTMTEADYAPVIYVPLADVVTSELRRTDHRSYCPYKGDAGYYSIPAAGPAGENAVWEYRDPYPAVAAIKDHVAFYADRVEIVEEV